MNAPWFFCEGEVVPDGAFEAVLALRGTVGSEVSQCRFGIGDARSPDFKFCDSNAVPTRPYCLKHSILCFKPKG